MPISSKFEGLLHAAVEDGLLCPTSQAHIIDWLTHPCYAEYRPELEQLIAERSWKELEEAFWTVLPFGTAGRRGAMYPVGCNAINRRTVGETILAAAQYVEMLQDTELPPTTNVAAVGFDVRHRSREFAVLACEILAQRHWQVHFLNEARSTPQLALAVRHFHAKLGFMITASHNPPSDNAVKVFWSHGGQMRPPHETAIASSLASVVEIDRMSYEDAVATGRILISTDAMDELYQEQTRLGDTATPAESRRDFQILFSPLHGVGMTSVFPALRRAGFAKTHVYPAHATPDPDFSNVPDRIANPEQPSVFTAMIDFAKAHRFQMILATDPDADRIGCAAPLTLHGSDWGVLNGNQIAALLAEFLLRRRAERGISTPGDYVVRTVVTTPMLDAIAARYGAISINNVLTGFKWIGAAIEEHGSNGFVLGAEEAHGYLVGTHIRDKDAGSASVVLAEYAANAWSMGRTLWDELDRLYVREGCYWEHSFSITLIGATGMGRMAQWMERFRVVPPASLSDMKLSFWLDFREGTERCWDRSPKVRADLPRGDVVRLELDEPGFTVAIRPSGTEPKIKFYLFGKMPVASIRDLHVVKTKLRKRLSLIEHDLRRYLDG